jgi:hypothetical protein
MKMKKLITILSVILFVFVGLTLAMQANAADETTVVQIISINTNGNNAAWLGAYKPLHERLNELNPKSTAHVYESRFVGTGAGTLSIVVEYPSMAYMEERSLALEANPDPELAKLIPALSEIGATVVSRSLYRDRAPEQVRDFYSAVYEVHTIDTHGKNDAFVEASKKIHERWLKVSKEGTVRLYQAMFAGENAGLITIAVGYPSMAYMEENGDRVASDEELVRLFTERDKIGAAVVSVGLVFDVTP